MKRVLLITGFVLAVSIAGYIGYRSGVAFGVRKGLEFRGNLLFGAGMETGMRIAGQPAIIQCDRFSVIKGVRFRGPVIIEQAEFSIFKDIEIQHIIDPRLSGPWREGRPQYTALQIGSDCAGDHSISNNAFFGVQIALAEPWL